MTCTMQDNSNNVAISRVNTMITDQGSDDVTAEPLITDENG